MRKKKKTYLDEIRDLIPEANFKLCKEHPLEVSYDSFDAVFGSNADLTALLDITEKHYPGESRNLILAHSSMPTPESHAAATYADYYLSFARGNKVYFTRERMQNVEDYQGKDWEGEGCFSVYVETKETCSAIILPPYPLNLEDILNHRYAWISFTIYAKRKNGRDRHVCLYEGTRFKDFKEAIMKADGTIFAPMRKAV